tara:strand:- start:634 stop:873 length:240 start_codon:yes stop_codon:yes gene_type:complete
MLHKKLIKNLVNKYGIYTTDQLFLPLTLLLFLEIKLSVFIRLKNLCLGIAGAIYKDSNILIFNETTSALDKITENLIIR